MAHPGYDLYDLVLRISDTRLPLGWGLGERQGVYQPAMYDVDDLHRRKLQLACSELRGAMELTFASEATVR
jgi:hypothetical protein